MHSGVGRTFRPTIYILLFVSGESVKDCQSIRIVLRKEGKCWLSDELTAEKLSAVENFDLKTSILGVRMATRRNKAVHSLPGRIRLRVPGLRGDPVLAEAIASHFASSPGISAARVNVHTGTILVEYSSQYWDEPGVILSVEEKRKARFSEPEQETGRGVREAVRTWSAPREHRMLEQGWRGGDRHVEEGRRSGWQRRLADEERAGREQAPERVNTPEAAPRGREDLRGVLTSPSVTRRSLKTIFTGFTLVLLLLKRQILGRSPLVGSEAVADGATVVGLIAAYPLFLWGLKHPQQAKRLPYDAIINALSFTLLVLQESIGGLLLTLLVHLSKLSMGIDQAKARQIIRQVGILPQRSWLIAQGVEVPVPTRRLAAGDLIAVHQGETIPVDGRVAGGEADVGESQLTGIPRPVWKGREYPVLAGSEVLQGHLRIRVERTGRSTRIGAMIRSAARRKSLADRVYQERMDRIVLFSLLLAGGVFLLTRDAERTLAVLFAGAPAAAGLALPTAAGVAVGQALDRGIYVRDEKHLLTAADINALVLDKTGTLTEEKAEIREITVIGREYTKAGIIRLAAAAERRAGHPVAQALRAQAVTLHGTPMPAPEKSEEISGFGVKARFKDEEVLIGNFRFMEREKVDLAKVEAKARRHQHLGLDPVFIAVNGQVRALLAVHEEISPQSAQLITALRAGGIGKIVLVTRDTREAAKRAADELGITEYYGELTPEDKAALVRSLKGEGFKVAVAGDGLDDAPAMAEAELGIAVGCMGVDSAAKVAGIVIPQREPQRVAEVIYLGQRLKERINQNLSIAFGLNVTGLGLGAAGILTTVGASVVGNIGVIAVIANTYGKTWAEEVSGGVGEVRHAPLLYGGSLPPVVPVP
ncbi:copper-transporting P-type ATPase [Peptococcaceae bacterium CEB3]|nr:copper-transporting P-type ATPase [Peptococcaceae bacterium CEB3]